MKMMLLFLMALAIGATTENQSDPTNELEGKDYYISEANGRGRVASKEQPAKDLGAIISLLKAGDRVHIAAGVYTSKSDRGSDIIEVPVSIIGGYNDDFSKRDPWGAYQTILSGKNDYNSSITTERLSIQTDKKFRHWAGTIVLDGLIIDNGDRNRYKESKQFLLLRKASGAAGRAASPSLPGIRIRAGAETNVEVRNCVLTNCASSQGVLDVQIGRDATATIENNLLVNNTGEGIMCKTNYHSDKNSATFLVRNNTVLFSWKYDAIASYGGSCLMMDTYTKVTAENNIFGFGHMGAVNNVKKCKSLTLTNNMIFGSKSFDYREFNSDMPLADLEDYAEFLDPRSTGNFSKTVDLTLDTEWAERYFSRVDISRAEVDAAVTVSNSDANMWRSILGLPLQGSTVSMDAAVFLHRMKLEDVMKLGMEKIEGAGCSKVGEDTL